MFWLFLWPPVFVVWLFGRVFGLCVFVKARVIQKVKLFVEPFSAGSLVMGGPGAGKP